MSVDGLRLIMVMFLLYFCNKFISFQFKSENREVLVEFLRERHYKHAHTTLGFFFKLV